MQENCGKNMNSVDISINYQSVISIGVQNFINMFFFNFLHYFEIHKIKRDQFWLKGLLKRPWSLKIDLSGNAVESKQLLDWATINIEILVKLLISALYWATLIFLLPLIRGLFTHFFYPICNQWHQEDQLYSYQL